MARGAKRIYFYLLVQTYNIFSADPNISPKVISYSNLNNRHANEPNVTHFFREKSITQMQPMA
jgi:hypothetical protein